MITGAVILTGRIRIVGNRLYGILRDLPVHPVLCGNFNRLSEQIGKFLKFAGLNPRRKPPVPYIGILLQRQTARLLQSEMAHFPTVYYN
ncbi:MAG: hypothetical protein K2G01_02670, partial [Paramuribaculum sp.]|nr:hypothetical protein [Paramuribaculum sp.]